MKNDQRKMPTCGSSDARNKEFEKSFNAEAYYMQLVHSDEPTIVDVGAHRGESVSFYKEIFPNAKMICFEPDEENFQILSEKVNGDSSCRVFKIGLSDKAGTASFFLNELSHLGSLKKINTTSQDSLGFAASAPNQESEITVDVLDGVCVRENISKIDILKIDVQGAELEVILGGKLALNFTDVIVIEINLFDFYEKDRFKLSNIFRTLEESGFELFDILNLSKNPRNFRTDWIEAVFIKR